MKKIFTFFMAMVVTLSMSAVTPIQSGKKADPTGRATELASKKLQHTKQVAKALGLDKVERKAAVKTAPEASKAPEKAQNEVITLNYDGFAGMMCVDPEFGEWWIGLGCDDESRLEYGHNLQLQWIASPDSPCGTFTTKDFVPEYTHLMTPTYLGSIMFSEMEMTITHEVVSTNLARYTLDATLLSYDGDTYIVHAVHEEIKAKGEVAVYIEDATLTNGEGNFTLEGKNDSLDLKLVMNNYDYVGTYNMDMIDWDNSAIAYKGVAVDPMTFKATIDLASHVETGALAYVTEIKMMGKDTVDYHFVLAAPLPDPTDTIELSSNNLTIDDAYAAFTGSVDFYANTPEYSIRGGWQADFAEEGTYEAAIFLDDANWNTITSLRAEVVLSTDEDENWAIEATMLGSDNKVYNLHLSWNVPEQKDTVVVDFETSAKAKYYPVIDETNNDIQLYNENEHYKASINVANVEMGGEFGEEDIISFFTYLEAVDGTPISVAEIKNGKLYQVGDTTKIDADYTTFEGVLYQVRLWYVAPTPTKTVALDIANADCYLDFEYSGQYTLFGYSEDAQYSFAVTVPAMSKEDIPGTFVNDGLFGKFGEGQYDFDASNSFVGKYNEAFESYDLYYIQKGQFTVALDEEDNITLTASVVCEDAIQYEVTLTSKYEEPHIEFDAEEGAVERIYGAEAELSITDTSEDLGIISVKITDVVVGDITVLWFICNVADAETVLPVGTYPINDTWIDGTVLASTGMDWDGSIMPSYYAGYKDNWVVEPYYFFQEGTAEVTKDAEGKLAIEVNAVNSCGIPVHIVYGNVASGMENINVNLEGVKKQIMDGQLVIIRGGKAYNAQGAQVK